ncbi:MAG: squalene synthase HpnC [Bacteroidetes bacterium]|nr:squalene synthase HpnC [Bacteroidota bacterium]
MKSSQDQALREAYLYCRRLARTHYENFPVASWLMPRRLRPHVAAVYAFARHADDLADEGVIAAEQRREHLEDWRAQLRAVETAGDGSGEGFVQRSGHNGGIHPVFLALGDTMRRFDIPAQLFHDLIDAFVQDTWKECYNSFDELTDYCRRSANPVGRIVLALFGRLDERTGPPSDALCTGLQLVNFWQDVSVDRVKPRLYVPLEDLARYSLTPADILRGKDTHATRTAISFQIERTKQFFHQALPLFPLVPPRLRLELSAIWRGGMRVLEKIEKQHYTVLQSRPALTAAETFAIVSAAVLKGSPDD